MFERIFLHPTVFESLYALCMLFFVRREKYYETGLQILRCSMILETAAAIPGPFGLARLETTGFEPGSSIFQALILSSYH